MQIDRPLPTPRSTAAKPQPCPTHPRALANLLAEERPAVGGLLLLGGHDLRLLRAGRTRPEGRGSGRAHAATGCARWWCHKGHRVPQRGDPGRATRALQERARSRRSPPRRRGRSTAPARHLRRRRGRGGRGTRAGVVGSALLYSWSGQGRWFSRAKRVRHAAGRHARQARTDEAGAGHQRGAACGQGTHWRPGRHAAAEHHRGWSRCVCRGGVLALACRSGVKGVQ